MWRPQPDVEVGQDAVARVGLLRGIRCGRQQDTKNDRDDRESPRPPRHGEPPGVRWLRHSFSEIPVN
jgi:hypothetical protein